MMAKLVGPLMGVKDPSKVYAYRWAPCLEQTVRATGYTVARMCESHFFPNPIGSVFIFSIQAPWPQQVQCFFGVGGRLKGVGVRHWLLVDRKHGKDCVCVCVCVVWWFKGWKSIWQPDNEPQEEGNKRWMDGCYRPKVKMSCPRVLTCISPELRAPKQLIL